MALHQLHGTELNMECHGVDAHGVDGCSLNMKFYKENLRLGIGRQVFGLTTAIIYPYGNEM